jgi:hypothetical protein
MLSLTTVIRFLCVGVSHNSALRQEDALCIDVCCRVRGEIWANQYKSLPLHY